jgi:predicted anti-sigma-YlaC factor YlaD
LCEEFQLQFDDYLESRLNSNRLLLMEDHLSRCPNCRAKLLEKKNGNTAIAMPVRRASMRYQ